MANETIKCPQCGAVIDGKSLYCNFCGASILDLKDIKDIKKKQIDLELLKEQQNEELRIQTKQHQMERTKMIIAFGTMILGTLLILIMMLFATGRI